MSGTLALQGIDAAWLALDSAGHVAIFTTGGEGPVPEALVSYATIVEEMVCCLPEMSEVDLRARVPRPDSFLAFARRGLYAYDWSDVHRSRSQALGSYELQAVPLHPRAVSELPVELQRIAEMCRTSAVLFGEPQLNPSAVGI
jgi:hypothetical protein